MSDGLPLARGTLKRIIIAADRHLILLLADWSCADADIGGEVAARAAGRGGIRGRHLHSVQAGGTASQKASKLLSASAWAGMLGCAGHVHVETDGIRNPDI